MDIGTAKPGSHEQARVPHSMIDLVDTNVEYSVREFQREARAVIAGSSQPVLLVGGSGLHMRAVIDPLEFPPTDDDIRAELEAADAEELVAELLEADPTAGEAVDLANTRRVTRAVEVYRLTGRTPSMGADDPARQAVARYEPLYPCRIIGLDPGDELATRIAARLDDMLARGFYDEVAGLVGRMGRTSSQAVGYSHLAAVVEGEADFDHAVGATRKATMDLARRQRSWFRRDPRVRWLNPLRDDPVAAVMEMA